MCLPCAYPHFCLAFYLFVLPGVCSFTSEETIKMAGKIPWLGHAGFRIDREKIEVVILTKNN